MVESRYSIFDGEEVHERYHGTPAGR